MWSASHKMKLPCRSVLVYVLMLHFYFIMASNEKLNEKALVQSECL